MAKKKETFENAMKRLEAIVRELESVDQPLELESAIKKFEEGIKLSHQINEMLKESENIIQILIENKNGEFSATPYENESDKD